MTRTIYALVDPNTHRVRYVGHTSKTIETRLHEHASASNPIRYLRQWIAGLAPAKPFIVALQEVEDATESEAIKSETEWLKRFRRTVLNKNQRENEPDTWDRLVNPND